MEGLTNHVLLSRLQFAMTALFHILWPVLSIGLSIFLLAMEALWLKSGDADYYRHARFWGKLFLLNFAVGVVTGLPLEFEFGTNWAPFSAAMGDFFGNILGFESAMAFMLEAGFIGIMIFGWNRVTPPIHLFATAMVTFGASLSAFWIMAANSWMQTPAGGHLEHGTFVIDSYFEGIFNPNMPWGVLHMWMACLETSLFVLGGISAWYLLKRRHIDFFMKSFRLAILFSLFVAPIQIWLGDGSARSVLKHQPAKGAAMEGHWETNRSGEGAAWSILAWPDQDEQRNDWVVQVPDLLSLLATRSLHGEVRGLKEISREDQPPAIPLLFYCFRVMVAIGFWFLGLAVWSLVLWRKGALCTTRIGKHRWFLKAWAAAVPMGFIAVEGGWILREVGRQPWVVYGMMRTNEAASALPPADIAFTLLVYGLIYTVLGVVFLAFARRLLRQGPDLDLEVPGRGTGPGQAMGRPSHPEEPFRLEERS